VLASDWYQHQHEKDNRYSRIILHVVWLADVCITDNNGQPIPTLVLQPRVPKLLLERYRNIMEAGVQIPCAGFLPALHALGWESWKERLAAERLQRKALQMLQLFQQTGNDWETLIWRLLAANFGIGNNSLLFEMMAQNLSYPLLARHRSQIHQLEALLMGQANLLNDSFRDSYACLLQKEYRFLQKKYQLQPLLQQPAFLRMRPAGFPTLRLAQLAMLIHGSPHLFQPILEAADPDKLRQWLQVTANDYWHYHFKFDDNGSYHPKTLGKQMADNLLINTAIPVLFAYGQYQKEDGYQQKAIDWLTKLPSEKNRILREWKQMGIPSPRALDSQALIELTNNYCLSRRCLDCAVGNKILKNNI
ncbi:MAG: DUF2851 family protein, partial [Bacteroidota bacterium]|nr:DUF2851 family protein [Bacteroidota bacterium]